MSTISNQPGFGRKLGKPIDGSFPPTGRTALVYLLDDLNDKNYLANERDFFRELNRLGRITKDDLDFSPPKGFINKVSARISLLEWSRRVK